MTKKPTERPRQVSRKPSPALRRLAVRASLRGGVWKILGKTERFSGRFSKDRPTLTGTWERHRGSNWVPWMEVTLIKAS